jgi:hypothetical protein
MPNNLIAYCQGFDLSSEDWPSLPLKNLPELGWWQELVACSANGAGQGLQLLRTLETSLPQLLLPQVDGISGSELYKSLVLRGEAADRRKLSAAGPEICWHEPEALTFWIANHPCGAMPVLQTPSWHDFAQLVRALAHRGEPQQLADGVHAQAISGLIHWGLIHRFGRQSRAQLIVLHEAPYGSVPAEQVPGNLNARDWLDASTTLRLEHELTHLATKRLLGEMRLNLLDELIADCMGMIAALGHFDANLFGRCLGIESDDGRWITYTDELSEPEAHEAMALVMTRSLELECRLAEQPCLLEPAQAMQRLQWLCRQRLDQQISSPPPAILH